MTHGKITRTDPGRMTVDEYLLNQSLAERPQAPSPRQSLRELSAASESLLQQLSRPLSEKLSKREADRWYTAEDGTDCYR